MKEKHVVDTLNLMLECCEPIFYDDFNKFIPTIDKVKLGKYEKENPKLGIASSKTKNKIGISTLSIIATITDIFCDKRLAAVIETEGKNKGKILKFDYAKYD